MADYRIDMKLAGAMNRRVFLHTIGTAAGSLTAATHLPGRRLMAGEGDAATFHLEAAEPNPKYGGTFNGIPQGHTGRGGGRLPAARRQGRALFSAGGASP